MYVPQTWKMRRWKGNLFSGSSDRKAGSLKCMFCKHGPRNKIWRKCFFSLIPWYDQNHSTFGRRLLCDPQFGRRANIKESVRHFCSLWFWLFSDGRYPQMSGNPREDLKPLGNDLVRLYSDNLHPFQIPFKFNQIPCAVFSLNFLQQSTFNRWRFLQKVTAVFYICQDKMRVAFFLISWL